METGEALKGFWMGALAIPDGGKSKIAFDWYRQFLQGMVDNGSYVWFAKLIAIGELLIGVGLIVGAFVGIAAFLWSAHELELHHGRFSQYQWSAAGRCDCPDLGLEGRWLLWCRLLPAPLSGNTLAAQKVKVKEAVPSEQAVSPGRA